MTLARAKQMLLPLLAATFGLAGAGQAQDLFQTGPQNYLAFSAGYSERYKESVGVDLVATDLFGSGTDIRLGGQVNDLGHQWTLDLGRTGPSKVNVFGRQADFRVGLTGQDYSWDDALYQNDRLGLYASLGFRVGTQSRLTVKAEVYRDTLSDVGPTTSPLIAAEAGRVHSTGLSLLYSSGNLGRRSGRGGFVQLDAYGLTGDATWVGLSAGYEVNLPLGDTFTGRFITRGGMARGVGSYDLRVTDRAFLGTDQLRGFAFGGVGPVDTDGTTITPLGGQKYASTSLEIGREVFATANTALHLSAFWDAGTVWDLPTTQGGFGPIDDSARIRQSAGLALDLDTDFGILSISYGKPLQKESYDRLQELSLSFKMGF